MSNRHTSPIELFEYSICLYVWNIPVCAMAIVAITLAGRLCPAFQLLTAFPSG
ncbi:MAG: hypothetical protein R3E32_03415 [Chitinophagales bacterium]